MFASIKTRSNYCIGEKVPAFLLGESCCCWGEVAAAGGKLGESSLELFKGLVG